MDDETAWTRLLLDGDVRGPDQPERICRLCVDWLGITGAGIARTTGAGTTAFYCASDAVSARVEELQITLGEGPCVDAIGGGQPVLVADLLPAVDAASGRWPAFAQAADAAGVRAVFAFPLRVGGTSVGTMDLYRDSPGDLTAAQLRGGLLAAGAAAVAVLAASSRDAAARPGEPSGAAAHEAPVHQATGMVQVQLGITTDEALLVLRAHAFATGRPLLAVARDVVDRRHRFREDDR